MKRSQTERFTDDKGNLLVEYVPGKCKPFYIPAQSLSLQDMKDFLQAVDAALDACDGDPSDAGVETARFTGDGRVL